MPRRCPWPTGAALAAGLLASVGMLTFLGPGARAAASTGGPALSLLGQSPWVMPTVPGNPKDFTLSLGAAPGTPGTDTVTITLYDHLDTRSGFEQTLNGTPTGLLDRTHPVAWSALHPGTGGASVLSVAVEPTPTATPAPPAGTPTLDLHCQADTGTCPGVYPAVVALARQSGATVARFTTYLVYAEAASTHPLHFALVDPLAAPVVFRSGTHDPVDAVAQVPASTAAALDGLVASLKANPQVPVTVAAAPQTLTALRDRGAAGRAAVDGLATLSTASTHEMLFQPFVPFDLNAYAGAGEQTEIAAQTGKGAATLAKLGVRTTAESGPWVATGAVGTALGTGLAQLGSTQVVVPDTAISSAASHGGIGTWSSTFTLGLGRGHTVSAAASDSELATHFTAEPNDPVLGAVQLLADLSMIHFEAPNTTAVRGVVAVPPAGWVPDAAFDDMLLSGLDQNPDVDATTLTSFFDQVQPTPTVPTRRLAIPGPGPVLTVGQSSRISAARLRLTGFDTALVGRPQEPILGQFDNLLLSAETNTAGSSPLAAGLDGFGRSLSGQLSLISLATTRTITLTSRTGKIPITVLSSAPYAVAGTLVVSGERFEFPEGNSQTMVIDHATNPVRVTVQARTSGDLPLDVVLTSPTGKLVITHGQLTVRSTATSAAGFVLTLLALAVLLAWWARTWWSGRRARRDA